MSVADRRALAKSRPPALSGWTDGRLSNHRSGAHLVQTLPATVGLRLAASSEPAIERGRRTRAACRTQGRTGRVLLPGHLGLAARGDPAVGAQGARAVAGRRRRNRVAQSGGGAP